MEGKVTDLGWQTIIGNCPSKSNCYRISAGGKGLFKTPALKAYEQAFFLQCGRYRGMQIKTLFEYHVRVYYPSMRTDLDNHCKIVLDAMQMARVITNDNLCVKIVAEKFIDRKNPRIEFKLITL